MRTKETQRLVTFSVIPLADQVILAPQNLYSAVQSAVMPNGREWFRSTVRGISQEMPMWYRNTCFRTVGELAGNQNPANYFKGVYNLEPRGSLTPLSKKGVLYFWSFPYERPIQSTEVEISNITSARKGLINFFRSSSLNGKVLYEIEKTGVIEEFWSIHSLKFKPPSEMNYTKLMWKLENPWFSSGINGAVGGGIFGLAFALWRGEDFRNTCVSTTSAGIAGALGAAFMSFATDQSFSTKALYFASSMVIGYVVDWGIQAVNTAIG